MGFWNLTDGKNAQQLGGSFEMGSGDIAPIPKDTSVLAIAEEAKNEEYQGNNYINVKWRISKPAEYANRVIFQKIKAYDANQQTADKAKAMLAAIASNAGGGLFQVMAQRNEMAPSDESLFQICNRPMVLKLGVWELDDKSKSGNWVMAVAPHGQQGSAAAAQPQMRPSQAPQSQPQQQPHAPKQHQAQGFEVFDDDIPFAPIGLSAKQILNCI